MIVPANTFLSLALYIVASVANVFAGVVHGKDLVWSHAQQRLIALATAVGVLKWVLKGAPKQ